MSTANPLHWRDLPAPVLSLLRDGAVIPAHPLALGPDRQFDKQSQCAIGRYYLDAGSGGLAVGVHSTQFAIREVGLYRSVLELAIETARDWTDRPLVMIAGAVGRTSQAIEEARTARALGYHILNLDVRETQTAAIRMYESLGYIRWGTHPAYARVQGATVKGMFFYKVLQPGSRIA